MSLVIPVDGALTLRLVEPEIADAVFDAFDGCRDHVGAWLPWCHPGYDREGARDWAKKSVTEFAERRGVSLAVFERDQCVGGVGFNGWQRNDPPGWDCRAHVADIGYWLTAGAQGRGVMARAVNAMVKLAFTHYAIDRLTIRAEPHNARSCAVAERAGFTLEGTLRGVAQWKGRRVDHRLYALLREEWDALNAARSD